MANATFLIPALDCPRELALIEQGLRPLAGISGLFPDYLDRRLKVEFDPRHMDAGQIADHIRQLGFPVEERPDDSVSEPRPGGGFGARLGLACVLLVLAGATRWYLRETSLVVAGLLVSSMAVSGWPVARAGWRAVRLGSLDMHALMTLAGAGACATGELFEAASAMFLFGVALALENLSLDRARRAIHSLLQLTPAIAHRLETAGTRDVPIDALLPGDRVLVKPGERIPVDGTVTVGESSVDQSPLTGESIPLEKTPGDQVFAGSLNGQSVLQIRADRPSNDSTLAHIARLIEQARQQRSPTERFVDRFARRYTPAVILLAVLIGGGIPILGLCGIGWANSLPTLEWVHRGLVVLVIACPCALVVSTPLTIVCGLHQAARHGILIKGGVHLENAARVDCVAFDKTGTLTQGQARVVGVQTAPGYSTDELLRVACSLASQSDHPLARAVVREGLRLEIVCEGAHGVSALGGLGLRGEWRGETWFVGSERWFREVARDSLADAAAWEAIALEQRVGSRVLVGTARRLAGVIVLADELRPDARACVEQLRTLGVHPIVMLTGDDERVARQVASDVSIDDLHANLLPERKVELVRELRTRHANLAMVGDGVNDAPALASATLGIALGSQSSDTAMETADVVIMSTRVTQVAELIRLGRRTRRVLSQNIALALGLKLLVLLLVLLGPDLLARLWLAVGADVGASLIVVANGMRLLRD